MGNAVDDLESLVEATTSPNSGVPVVMLGHSMGGLLAVCFALAHHERLSGLILSAPLAALEAASVTTRLAARVLSVLTPQLGVARIDSALISRDPEVVRFFTAVIVVLVLALVFALFRVPTHFLAGRRRTYRMRKQLSALLSVRCGAAPSGRDRC